jgi:hypothetical protein
MEHDEFFFFCFWRFVNEQELLEVQKFLLRIRLKSVSSLVLNLMYLVNCTDIHTPCVFLTEGIPV